ncbi:hypothetical protein TIFTF001_042517 [Ficus carica]|uniref:Uncharacterized protein n=1 Tax=Ficus carica TaxID=3494 RepID=A0AA87ZH69_FICCA|nr:hypothetical protein TIFTF001_042517 [Ficus carica]
MDLLTTRCAISREEVASDLVTVMARRREERGGEGREEREEGRSRKEKGRVERESGGGKKEQKEIEEERET